MSTRVRALAGAKRARRCAQQRRRSDARPDARRRPATTATTATPRQLARQAHASRVCTTPLLNTHTHTHTNEKTAQTTNNQAVAARLHGADTRPVLDEAQDAQGAWDLAWLRFGVPTVVSGCVLSCLLRLERGDAGKQSVVFFPRQTTADQRDTRHHNTSLATHTQ